MGSFIGTLGLSETTCRMLSDGVGQTGHLEDGGSEELCDDGMRDTERKAG